ncbi:hypothetical protein Fmac_019403 [Flemingia macrophylla]|uniref:Uncharacterized protein n=1 Tax=Flemingia macrophylla TaxID=520843 RepID=A0ABD1M7S9_9FABA
MVNFQLSTTILPCFNSPAMTCHPIFTSNHYPYNYITCFYFYILIPLPPFLFNTLHSPRLRFSTLTKTMADSDRSSTAISSDSSGNRGSSKVEFSEDEETLIIRMYKLVGERWSLIAGRIPGRTAEEIEKYWNSRFSSSSE